MINAVLVRAQEKLIGASESRCLRDINRKCMMNEVKRERKKCTCVEWGRVRFEIPENVYT